LDNDWWQTVVSSATTTEDASPVTDGDHMVAELVRVSRLIGQDPRLVLHGGGNTSLKMTATDVTGLPRELLLMKGSGHDLATIDSSGFAALRLARLRDLLPPTPVADADLKNELGCARVDAAAPDPSVETLIHAYIPFPAVVHSHADVILTLTNTADGERRIQEIYGSRVIVLPYAMPGVDLVAACAREWPRQFGDSTEGVVVLGHGLFAFAATPREALERHSSLIRAAEEYLVEHVGGQQEVQALPLLAPVSAVDLARVRKEISDAAGTALVIRRTHDAQIRAFLADPSLVAASAQGPLTPDHVTWTRRVPMIGTDVSGYAAQYRSYFEQNRGRRSEDPTMLDPAPRVVLDQALGMLSVGRTGREAGIAEDVYRHTMDAIVRAEALGGYRALSSGHVFDLEYWSLQQQKVSRVDRGLPLSGQVALVTGAASGIGRACAAALLDAGASVVGWDLSGEVANTFEGTEWLGLTVDVTDGVRVREALLEGVEAFGGVDILVVGAGIFPSSSPLDGLDMATWRRTMSVNVDSVAELYGVVHPLLALAPGGGRVVLIASKNVAAPGPGAAAYSASKAAVTQLTRVAALEWAGDGIRVNIVHPDAVFDTGLWTSEVLAARAEHYGMSVEKYKRRNLLGAEITSAAVGRLVCAMVGDAFACTTGAQVPIDGGNERVI
jgi:rhamnose utilization protein RhaD (predicted bifunctional aldolase and dehydrogenase)/NAD(P)-dependent dehydrogenase (short-subunit alcohol dehydrogenase family)